MAENKNANRVMPDSISIAVIILFYLTSEICNTPAIKKVSVPQERAVQ